MIRSRGFTLIELLVVVAILAIVVAIAIPNLLTAQTRAKVSRAKADMRALTTALEAYATDFNAYPICNSFGTPGNRTPVVTEEYLYLELLSTPVAYITNAFPADPFEPTQRITVAAYDQLPGLPGQPANTGGEPQWRSYTYTSWNSMGRTTGTGEGFDIESVPRSWLLQSAGPDLAYFNVGGILDNFSSEQTLEILYDPTNGSISYGAVFRVGGTVGSEYGSRFASAVRGVE